MSVRIEIPKDEIADFCRRNHIRRLALFGSVLRDDFSPDSDIDVLVEFKPGVRVLKLRASWFSFVWPKASITVAWGETPGNSNDTHILAEGHIQIHTVGRVNMACGQTDPKRNTFLGRCPRLR